MLAPIGDLFMQLIKMIVVPMVFFSLVGGAAALGKSKGAGKVGIVTFLYYGVTTAVAVILGLAFSVFFQPGSGIDMAAISGAAVQVGDLSKAGALPGFWETIIGFVPANPVKALTDGNILQIITFSLLSALHWRCCPQKRKSS